MILGFIYSLDGFLLSLAILAKVPPLDKTWTVLTSDCDLCLMVWVWIIDMLPYLFRVTWCGLVVGIQYSNYFLLLDYAR